jgi:serine/threonine protein kinase
LWPIVWEAFGGRDEWLVTADESLSEPWIMVARRGGQLPVQGWKLHLSAALPAAEEVLRRAVPVLRSAKVSFKVTSSLAALAGLNDGRAGLSQVGKFITVYPIDDPQAVEVAVALDRATRGLPGPRIPSDRPLAPDSLVFYRYGSFGERLVQLPTGQQIPAISTPSGELQPDYRRPTYTAPEWVVDPFRAAGVTAESTATIGSDRFVVVSTLHRSARGAVCLVLDLTSSRRCILKSAGRDAQKPLVGPDARDRLRHEASILELLGPDPRFPTIYEWFEQDGDVFLAMEDVEGTPLAEEVGGWTNRGENVPVEQVTRWGQSIVGALAAIHQHGIVYRDLKPANVIVAPNGSLRLIDFEISQASFDRGPLYGIGTRGYMSPQQAAGAPPDPVDDVYSLGALLYFLLTGAEPSLAPHPFALLDRPIELLNPEVGSALADIVQRCLAREPRERYSSVEQVATALASFGKVAEHAVLRSAAVTVERPDDTIREHYRVLARRLGDSLARVARPSPNSGGLVWPSTYRGRPPVVSRDLYDGVSGIAFALAELVTEVGDPRHRELLRQALDWLQVGTPSETTRLSGLYMGESGVGVAMLRAGQVLDDHVLIAAAAERGRWVGHQPQTSPDLTIGAAGRLLFHLLLWDETSEVEQREAAIAAGDYLVETAETMPEGIRWRIPPGFAGLSGSAYFGSAHGAAGIADALLELFEVTRNERFLTAAMQAARWLRHHAFPTLPDGSGLGWATDESRKAVHHFWCYGAAGIGSFFLHLARLNCFPESAALAARAARTVGRAARWGDPTRCHGLAGNIDFLLDVARDQADPRFLDDAYAQARLLEVFATEVDGVLAWPSDSPEVFTPDFQVGYSGVALTLLRLGAPNREIGQISRRRFREKDPRARHHA